uniref:Maltose O-acetyltransferase n=1 Tax=Streptococcus suis TaxID=1307 RepID=A0A1P8VRJ5_STRSU|nr:Maltose O-acetyltransferase [Streptococcus suis]
MNRSSNYNMIEKIENLFFLILTKLLFKSARLIRFPVYLRGGQYMDLGNQLTLGRYCRFDVLGNHKSKKLVFGRNVCIGDYVRISCVEKIEVGNDVLIGSRVLIIDNSHGNYAGENQDSPLVPPNHRGVHSSPILIGDNVWIGEGVVIQKGVTIGSGSIIAANTVITKNVPSNCIVAGLPGKVIKEYNFEKRVWI